MKIIRRRELITTVGFLRQFDYEGHPGWGYAFPCDEAGNLAPATNPDAAANCAKCVAGVAQSHPDGGEPRPLIDRGIIRTESEYWQNAVGACDDCGAEVYLSGFTNSCECGADFNRSGQRLAPREQWGEETGESLSDILGADSWGEGDDY